MVNNLIGFGVGGGASLVSYDYLGVATSTANQVAYTFSDFSAVDPGACKLVVGIIGDGGTAGRLVASATVDSNSATNRVEVQGATTGVTASFFDIEWAGGALGDILVTFDAGQGRARIYVWAVYAAATGAPHDTGGDHSSGTLSDTINVTAGGAAFGIGSGVNGSVATHSWTNLTEETSSDSVVEGNHSAAAAAALFSADQTGLTVTDTLSVAHTNSAAAFISYATA